MDSTRKSEHVRQDAEDEYNEFEYFEDEVVSFFDSGLSTILEGDNESCSSRQSDPSEKLPISPERSVPRQISMTPSDPRSSLEYSSKLWALLSPMMFSPMDEARKLKKLPFKLSSSDSRHNILNISLPPGRENHAPKNHGTPMVLTNLETGDELLWMELDDDEFTFVTCDTESMVGVPLSQHSEDLYTPLGSGPCPAEDTFAEGPSQMQMKKLDFAATRWQLELALQRRMKKGKLVSESMDYMKRKLRYDLQRKMIKDRLNCFLRPSKLGA